MSENISVPQVPNLVDLDIETFIKGTFCESIYSHIH